MVKPVFAAVLILLLLAGVAAAQEMGADFPTGHGIYFPNVHAGMSPDNPFYFLETFFDNVKIAFATDKVEARLEVAQKKLLEEQEALNKGNYAAAGIADGQRQDELARATWDESYNVLWNDWIINSSGEYERVNVTFSRVNASLQAHLYVLMLLQQKLEEENNTGALNGISNALNNTQTYEKFLAMKRSDGTTEIKVGNEKKRNAFVISPASKTRS